MRNEIGENRVLFCVWGERREDNRPRETADYRVLFGMCVNLKLREYHMCENEMGIGKVNHTLEFALMESFFFNQPPLESVCEFWLFLFFLINFLYFILLTL
jgi:hypothetical protein